MKMLKLKILDKLIIATLVVLSILPTGVLMVTKFNTQNTNIVIKVGSKVVKTIPFKNIADDKTYQFDFNGNVGYLEVKNGRVRMVEMDKKICPNAICSDTGWIDKAYQTIVCLPNRIVVSFEGAKAGGIDVTAF